MAYEWIIIGLIAFVIFMLVFKSQDLMFFVSFFKKNFFYILLLGVFFFFAFSLYHIHTVHGINLASFEGFLDAIKIYYNWGKVFLNNLGSITGYAINQDWLVNSTNSTNLTRGS